MCQTKNGEIISIGKSLSFNKFPFLDIINRWIIQCWCIHMTLHPEHNQHGVLKWLHSDKSRVAELEWNYWVVLFPFQLLIFLIYPMKKNHESWITFKFKKKGNFSNPFFLITWCIEKFCNMSVSTPNRFTLKHAHAVFIFFWQVEILGLLNVSLRERHWLN